MLKGIKNFYKQYISSNPDNSLNTNIRTLQKMSKGFLLIGAITSMGFTIPTIYSLLNPIFSYEISILLTILSVLTIFFIVDLSLGSLTPFVMKYTFSESNHKSNVGGLLLWLMIIFLSLTTMYMTYNGSIIPVLNSIQQPLEDDVVELEKQKQSAILAEEKRFKTLLNQVMIDDSINLSKLKNKHHKKIIKSSNSEKSIIDSTNKVSEFINNSKTTLLTNQMILSIDDARNSWNRIIREKKEDYNRNYLIYEKRIKSTMLIFQVLGTISTGLFFIIQLICSLIIVEVEVEERPRRTQFRKSKFKNDFFDEM